MSLSQKQSLKQTQSLALTPQLLHSIKILQLSSSELHDHLLEEVDKNPLLEVQGELYRNYAKSPYEARDYSDIEGNTPSLVDTLEKLIKPLLFTENDQKIGDILINSLDDAGYLTETLENLAITYALDIEDCEQILAYLQEAAPAGIGARSLEECLTLQLKAKGRYDPMIAIVISNLPLLAKRDFQTLKKLAACDDQDIADMVNEIRALDPKPGLAFSSSPFILQPPDVLVRIVKGELIVQLNPDLLPLIHVNKSYLRKLPNETFVKDMSHNAYSLIKMLNSRYDTLLKVAVEIALQQKTFIKGEGALAPMTLHAVSEAINMHESTISRAIMGKSIETPRGVMELKAFFTNAVNDQGLASDAVKNRIKSLILTENKPLSDDDLVKVLKQEGMELARRTVAKYREGMGIPTSQLRKREKSLKVS